VVKRLQAKTSHSFQRFFFPALCRSFVDQKPIPFHLRTHTSCSGLVYATCPRIYMNYSNFIIPSKQQQLESPVRVRVGQRRVQYCLMCVFCCPNAYHTYSPALMSWHSRPRGPRRLIAAALGSLFSGLRLEQEFIPPTSIVAALGEWFCRS
jgi:hypothetical protein